MKRFSLYVVSFLGGYLIMGLELMGFRLLAPYFGYSIYVFGSLIGLILFALSVGYLIGGYLGDRNVRPRTFFQYFFFGALYLFGVSIAHPVLLEQLSSFPSAAGSLAAAAALFAVPMVFLAALSPYLIRLLASNPSRGVGVSAGTLYAVSTIGSLAGTFLTAFYLVPDYGVRFTFFLNAGLMMTLSLPAVIRRAPYLLVLLALPLLFRSAPADPHIFYQTDSPYTRLEVVDYGTFLGLRTDRRSEALHSYRPKDGSWNSEPTLYNLFALAPALNGAKRILLLGVAGGVIPMVHERFSQDVSIDGVELDPKMLDVGKEYFYLNDASNLRLIVDDARSFLRKSNATYDVIEMDIFNGSAEVPFYLATKEFFASTLRRLTPNGIFAMNLYDPSHASLRNPILNTIAAAYPEVYYAEIGSGSHFVLAARERGGLEAFLARLAARGEPAPLASLIDYFAAHRVAVSFNPAGDVFTDDRAPLERLSYRALSAARR